MSSTDRTNDAAYYKMPHYPLARRGSPRDETRSLLKSLDNLRGNS
jgi:hypothetical protein